ncbi:MAG: dihydrodipicolinate reductase [Clostridia bacterium]
MMHSKHVQNYGINAISTCEEALYPQNSIPNMAEQLDRISKENDCTICGSGYQDIFWGNLIATIAGATHKITKIVGSSSYNVEDYGIALAKAHGAGLTLEEFDEKIASADKISDEQRKDVIESGKYLPSYMWNVNGWLADRLDLSIANQTQVTVPQTYKTDLNSSTLGMVVKAGDATGMSAVVTTKTIQGIDIVSECIGKVYAPDEFDKNEWTIYGQPDTTVTINRPATVELTCATIVNRIPDVINAKSGFVTTDKMPVLQYRTKSLDEYLDI